MYLRAVGPDPRPLGKRWTDSALLDAGFRPLRPSYFSEPATVVVRSVGIDLNRFETEFYDRDWRTRHGLAEGYFFARETFGVDRLVRAMVRALIPGALTGSSIEEFVTAPVD